MHITFLTLIIAAFSLRYTRRRRKYEMQVCNFFRYALHWTTFVLVGIGVIHWLAFTVTLRQGPQVGPQTRTANNFVHARAIWCAPKTPNMASAAQRLSQKTGRGRNVYFPNIACVLGLESNPQQLAQQANAIPTELMIRASDNCWSTAHKNITWKTTGRESVKKWLTRNNVNVEGQLDCKDYDFVLLVVLFFPPRQLYYNQYCASTSNEAIVTVLLSSKYNMCFSTR